MTRTAQIAAVVRAMADDEPPPSGTRLALAPAPDPILAPAPGLLAGPGEQRDCARWAECLSLLLRRAPSASAGHCARGCDAHIDPRAADRVLALRQHRTNFET